MLRRIIPTGLILLFFISNLLSQQLAFPTAEGYGKYTIGGRGGTVYEVTNLNDSGEGSLRAAVEASEPRTVVFRISGNIELESSLIIENPFITIAGQTAPGDGICIKRYPLIIEADHVIIRYLRVRFGDESGEDSDAVSSRYTKHIILDHISASWSVDECMSIYHCDSITVQWCIISESMFKSNHVKGTHGFGGIWGSNYSTYHHNLIAHHASRNPRMASGSGYTDYRNNVIYNWGYNSCYGGENQQVGSSKYIFSKFNIVANYYKPGPATKPGAPSYRIANPSMRGDESDFGLWYIADNEIEGNDKVTQDNWNGGVQAQGGNSMLQFLKLEEPWLSMPINQETAREAYNSVLEKAGATLPKRDPIDIRIISETKGGFASYEGSAYKQNESVSDPSKKCGIIDSQKDVGGWPVLKSIPAPLDTDKDGMPDDWESRNQLDKENPEDRNIVGSDGYTMLEKYLNIIKTFTKPRIIISSDIGGTDPDDNQSMVHFLMYSDRFETEGLISSPSYGSGTKQNILDMIALYEKDLPELKKHNSDYPSPATLRTLCKQGRKGAAPFIGYKTATEGSDWIIKCAGKESEQPLWLLVWGGLDDLAQALHDAPEIQSALRVYWIGGPNKKWSTNSYSYIIENFPELWFVEANASYRGFFSNSNVPDSLRNNTYYDRYINGAGYLGENFKNYYSGNIKMGDTPSLLYLMSGDPHDPLSSSWGGSFEKITHSPRFIFSRNTTTADTVSVYSIVEYHIEGPVKNIPSDSICFTMTVNAGVGEQKWAGYYLGEGKYAIRYAPKKSETLTYEISSSIPGFPEQNGQLVVNNLWPGEPCPDNYKLGSNWYTDSTDPELFDNEWQGAKTVLKWRTDVLIDWAERWTWFQ